MTQRWTKSRRLQVTPLLIDGTPGVQVVVVDDQPAFRRAARNVVAVLPELPDRRLRPT